MSHNHPSYGTQVASASLPPNQIVKLKYGNLMVEKIFVDSRPLGEQCTCTCTRIQPLKEGTMKLRV
jgi:hypothetical protein